MAIKFSNDFKEFLKLLNENDVQYLLVGGYAVSFYGYLRTTKDMDIWIALNETNASKMVEVLHKFGVPQSSLNEAIFLTETNIFRMGVPPHQIEIINTIDGVTFEDCYGRRVDALIDKQKVFVISLEDLKMNKLKSGRHRDLDDLHNLP